APNMKDMTTNGALTIVGIAAVLTLVAILIDRRALLVSALAYLGAVIGYAITGTATDRTAIFFATLVILGVLVLTIGVAWFPLRRALVRLLPPVRVAGLRRAARGCGGGGPPHDRLPFSPDAARRSGADQARASRAARDRMVGRRRRAIRAGERRPGRAADG